MPDLNRVHAIRHFLFRLLLVFGIALGGFTLLEVPFVALGGGFSLLGDLAFVANSLIIAPASILGFWFKRTAVACLTVCAVLTAAGLAFGHVLRPGDTPVASLLKAAPIGLALCLGLLEFLPGREP